MRTRLKKRHATQLPDALTHNVLSRFTAGVTSKRIAEVSRAGGIEAWFEQQLTPADIPDHQADALRGWFPDLALTPLQRWEATQAHDLTPTELTSHLASWIMLRRLITQRQVEEMMVDVWSNLFHVSSLADSTWVYRVEYEEMIRSHALGRFEDLLQAAIPHPCLGLYSNNVRSTSRAVIENLGRYVLEFHTVGAPAGYTESDVLSSTRILTGFRVDEGGTWQAAYSSGDHWVGRVRVMGFSSPNKSPDGRPVLRDYLSYLAHHPATAQRVCSRLATRFVSDTPSQSLIDSLAQVYLDSDTAIVPVLRALLASDEFLGSARRKVRTPVEDAVATWSALGVSVARPRHEADAANQLIVVSGWMGQVVYDWPTPDGFPDLGRAWTGSARILGSMRLHWSAARGLWPKQGITYKTPMDWMPVLPATFADVVDHVVRTTVFLPCSPRMLEAACLATDISPNEVIDASSPLIRYKFPLLMVTILDSPEHFSR
jgi:uncharacterized protein (DUF1800 family)